MISVACEMPFYGTGDCNMLSKKQERERSEVRKHTNNGRTPPWYAPDGHKATSNFAVRDSVTSAQPSVGLAPTHAPDSATGPGRAVENDAEMAERAWACQFYSRGEIPPWLREWSPRDDLTFIRSIKWSHWTD